MAVGRFAVPSSSPCIVESKSLKLYLGGLYKVSYDSWAALEMVLAADLSAAAGAPVEVTLESLPAFDAKGFDRFLGSCVDMAPLRPEAGLLAGEGSEPERPVSSQPSSPELVPRDRSARLGFRWNCSLRVQARSRRGARPGACAARAQRLSRGDGGAALWGSRGPPRGHLRGGARCLLPPRGHRYHALPGLGTNVLQSPAPGAPVIGSRARRAATISPCRSRVMG